MSVGHPSESMLAVPEFEPTCVCVWFDHLIFIKKRKKKEKKRKKGVCVFTCQYHKLVHASTYAMQTLLMFIMLYLPLRLLKWCQCPYPLEPNLFP
jgi:hypothetical protein